MKKMNYNKSPILQNKKNQVVRLKDPENVMQNRYLELSKLHTFFSK